MLAAIVTFWSVFTTLTGAAWVPEKHKGVPQKEKEIFRQQDRVFHVDYIYRKGYWKLGRRIHGLIGFSLVIIGLIGSIYQVTIAGYIIFLSIAVFGADMTLSPS